jgi:uncharacterized protein
MGTFLRLALVLFGIWLVLKLVKRALLRRDHPPSPANLPPADMLRCEYCGTFVPRSEAVTAGDRHFCNRQHADAYRQRG